MWLQFTDELGVDLNEGFACLFIRLQYKLGGDGGLAISQIFCFNTVELQKTEFNTWFQYAQGIIAMVRVVCRWASVRGGGFLIGKT